MSSAPDVLIVGASARAAAFATLRAGRRPACIDLFADADLRARCPTIRLEAAQYPRGFDTALSRDALAMLGLAASAVWSLPWMYTGGLENHPRIVELLTPRLGPLLGNPGSVLRAVRNPFAVREALSAADIPCPNVRRLAKDKRPAGRWLVKPRQGSGGVGILFLSESVRSSKRVYLQEFIEGDSYSAVFAADGNACQLLGVTQQLVGERWLHAGPFSYCGSIGPLSITTSLEEKLRRLSSTVVLAFKLRGLFGVDFILRDDVPWPVEINPRWPASVEVLEAASGKTAFKPTDGGPWVGVPRGQMAHKQPCVGKAILFAKERVAFPAHGPWADSLRAKDAFPVFADIPHAGEVIEAHRPVLTFFATADSPVDGLARLQAIASTLDHCLFGR